MERTAQVPASALAIWLPVLLPSPQVSCLPVLLPSALAIWLPVLLPSPQVSCLPLLLPASIEQTVARSARMCAHLQGTQQRPKPPSSRTPTYLELDEAEMNELEEVCLFGACCWYLVDRVPLVGAVW